MVKVVIAIIVISILCGILYMNRPSKDNNVIVTNGRVLSNVNGNLSIRDSYSSDKDYDYIINAENMQKGVVLEKGETAFVPIGYVDYLDDFAIIDMKNKALRVDFN